MPDTLDARSAARALAAPVGEAGGRFMLHPDTFAFGAAAGYHNPLAFYVAGRGGVLGDVDADVVVAAFGFFEPATVRGMWNEGVAQAGARAAGHTYSEACQTWGRTRLEGAGVNLARLCELAERLLAAAPLIGLGLFAAWRAQPRPDDAAGRAALLLHVMREWRGAAHVAATAVTGLDPLSAVYAKGGEAMARLFGWRGDLPDVAGLDELIQRTEEATDDIVSQAFEALTVEERAELVSLVESTRMVLAAAG